jgi:hypothetical protein
MEDTSRLFNHKLHLRLNSLQLVRSSHLLKLLLSESKKGHSRETESRGGEKMRKFLKKQDTLLSEFKQDARRVDQLLTETINIVHISPWAGLTL